MIKVGRSVVISGVFHQCDFRIKVDHELDQSYVRSRKLQDTNDYLKRRNV